MNPNSISHRLFAAALAPGGQSAPKRPAVRPEKPTSKASAAKSAGNGSAATAKLNEWAWSGWQHPTI